MKFLKYFLLATLIHGYPSCSMGQTVGKQLEFNSAWGVDYESNMVKNPSAAKNLNDTLKLGATLSRDTSSGNKIDGKASFLLDAGGVNDYLELALHTPNDEQTSGNCGFKGLFKGDARLYRAQILDGSANVLAQTVPLTNETGWREFRVWYPCGASGARKVRITQTEAGTAPAINVGKFYYGRMEPGAGTSPNTFTAKVSETGIVSNVTPPGWLTNFSVIGIDFTGTTFKSGLFTQTPNCIAVVDTPSGANFTYSIRIYNTTTSTIGVSSNTADATTAAPFTISCTKTGSDYVQPAITPDQWNFGERAYTSTVTGLGSGSATTIASYSRDGSYINICIQITKDAIAGTGATTVEATIPSGITINTANWTGGVKFGTGWSSANSSNTALAIDPSTSKLLFYFGNAASTGSSYTANSTTRGCISFPASEGGVAWTENQNAPLLLNTVYADTAVKAEKAAGLTSVDYGTYTSTFTSTLNLSAITSTQTCQYSRVGNVVEATCPMTATCSAGAGTLTSATFTLPIATTQGSTIKGTFGTIVPTPEQGWVTNSSNIGLTQWRCGSTSSEPRVLKFSYLVP